MGSNELLIVGMGVKLGEFSTIKVACISDIEILSFKMVLSKISPTATIYDWVTHSNFRKLTNYAMNFLIRSVGVHPLTRQKIELI